MTQVAVCDCHLHYMTAKKATGFAVSHNTFGDELWHTIGSHQVRIEAGDFNLSLWIVAREMRQRNAQTTLAAAFAFADPNAWEADGGSCGILHWPRDEHHAPLGSASRDIRE